MAIFEDLLHADGWRAGHAPEGLIAEKVKYKVGDSEEWLPYFKIIPQVPTKFLHYPCALDMPHDEHRFALEVNMNDKAIVQICPGVTK